MSASYQSRLRRAEFCPDYVEELIGVLGSHLEVTDLPRELLTHSRFGPKIPGGLGRLPLAVAAGARSWEGLVVGFPGRVDDLRSESIGTPFLRLLLYPLLELHRRLELNLGRKPPCRRIQCARGFTLQPRRQHEQDQRQR